ncbi:unnamed protein product, partial [Phaeothamnion confervicola]
RASPTPGSQRRLADAEIKELLLAYESGCTIRDLATSFGIGRTTVQAHLDRGRVIRQARGPKLVGSALTKAVEMYSSGMSLQAVGEALCVDAKTVSRALRNAGVEVRPRPGWSRE